jgi:hypothetical protein
MTLAEGLAKVSQEGTGANRFLTAWKGLEAEISFRWGVHTQEFAGQMWRRC